MIESKSQSGRVKDSESESDSRFLSDSGSESDRETEGSTGAKPARRGGKSEVISGQINASA